MTNEREEVVRRRQVSTSPGGPDSASRDGGKDVGVTRVVFGVRPSGSQQTRDHYVLTDQERRAVVLSERVL